MKATMLKLVRTNLNDPVLEIITAAIYLSNNHSAYAHITQNECHAWLHLYKFSPHERSAWKANKYIMRNTCPLWDSNS